MRDLMRDDETADVRRREDQSPAQANSSTGGTAAPAAAGIADADALRFDIRDVGELRDLGGHDVERPGTYVALDPAGKAALRSADNQPVAVEYGGARRRRRSTPAGPRLPSSGIVAPGTNGSGCGALASCASIQPRCSNAQRTAERRLVRGGQVSFRTPRRSSIRSRIRRALRTARISSGSGSDSSGAGSERPIDHMPFKLAGVVLADRPAARRLAGLVDRLAAPGNQIMPFGQRLAVGAQAIGAGLRQPVEPVEIGRGRTGRNRRPSSCGWDNRCSGLPCGRAIGRRRWSDRARPVSSSSNLWMQQRAQPSHNASHSPRSRLRRGFSQNGGRAFMTMPALLCYARTIKQQVECGGGGVRFFVSAAIGREPRGRRVGASRQCRARVRRGGTQGRRRQGVELIAANPKGIVNARGWDSDTSLGHCHRSPRFGLYRLPAQQWRRSQHARQQGRVSDHRRRAGRVRRCHRLAAEHGREGRFGQSRGRDGADHGGPGPPCRIGQIAAQVRRRPRQAGFGRRLFGARLCQPRSPRPRHPQADRDQEAQAGE